MSKNGPRMRGLINSLAPLLGLVTLSLVLAALNPRFGTRDNLLTVSVQTAVIAILALGQTLVIIAGGIDLSVGSVLGLAGVVSCWLMREGWGALPAGLAGVAAGGLCGFLNGAVCVWGRIPAFIATLGMLGIARGLVLVFTGGGSLHAMAPGFAWLGGGKVSGVPVPVLVVVGLAAVLWALLGKTRFGRYVHAVGGNREATRLSGVPVNRCLILVFTLAGVCSGLAGVLMLSRVGGVASPNAGEGYELDAVAAAVIGGASLAGGEGGIAGSLIGALLMGVLRNGCNLLNMSAGWQRVTIGVLIVGAVFYDQIRRRAREK